MTSEFAIAVHALVYLNHRNATLASEELAGNVCTNPARIRKVMAKLKKKGLVATKEGQSGGYHINGSAGEITLDLIYDALESEAVCPSWKSGKPGMPCMIASGMSDVMDEIYSALNQACRERLQKMTLADVDRKIFHSGIKREFGYNLILIGFMGTGKSTLARTLQSMYGLEMTDMDEEIQKRENRSISEIFETEGEEYFRKKETELLKELSNKKDLVISCGGGVPLREENVAEMKKSGKVILLCASPDTILKRLEHDHSRPLLEQDRSREHLAALMAEREEKYRQAADLMVDTEGKSEEQICCEIIRKIAEK